ncbi:MAG: glycosyltransferase family 2 protein [bacterium]|nr:glycosyltransferase family 2 protein [bacterium]
MNSHNVQYSVVVPVYNSEGSLGILYERLSGVFNSLGGAWELILVNDCSKDKSWAVMRELASKDSRITAINLANNFGQHSAVICGLSYVSGEYVITLDDDLQHPPEEIPKLIKTIKDGGYSVVYGQYQSRRYKWFKNACSIALNKLISKITGSGYIATTFRILTKSVAEKLTGFKQHNVIVDVLIKDIVSKRDVGHVAVEHHERGIGSSSYSYGKLFAHALNMIFNYTVWPLRLATILGLVLSLLSISLGMYFFVDYFINRVPVAGFTTIMVVMAFLFGMILFVLGIIGEYIGRIFLNINQKPQFCVKEVYGRGKLNA